MEFSTSWCQSAPKYSRRRFRLKAPKKAAKKPRRKADANAAGAGGSPMIPWKSKVFGRWRPLDNGTTAYLSRSDQPRDVTCSSGSTPVAGLRRPRRGIWPVDGHGNSPGRGQVYASGRARLATASFDTGGRRSAAQTIL